LIRLHPPARLTGGLAFAYSPLIEAIFSLQVLTEPKHHPLQHNWVRSARRLPVELKHRIGAFAYKSFPTPVDPTDGLLTFREELDSLVALEKRFMAVQLVRPFALDLPPTSDVLESPQVRQTILERAAEHGPDTARVIGLVLDDPRSAVEQLAGMLNDYWESAFEGEWERIEPLLADTVSEAGRELASGGEHSFLSHVAPQVRVDTVGNSLLIDLPFDDETRVRDGIDWCWSPSAYIWPHMGVGLDPALSPTLVYSDPFMLEQTVPRIPQRNF
jgi:hypothetical protein